MKRGMQLLPESSKPFLLDAIHAWCVAQGYSPFVVVKVDYPGVEVPPGYDRDGRIVLDLSPSAVHGLQMVDAWIHFQARFGGVARRISVPMAAVVAIYAAETQEGMGFPEPILPVDPDPKTEKGQTTEPQRPSLRVVK
ncbi:MAG: ClpXP protease specificity-enhancing factor SspB [Candidatus Igneacidithiobacillus chanchocoensis]